MYQVGIYANLDSGAEILYVILQSDVPVNIPEYAPTDGLPDFVFDFIVDIVHGSTSGFTVQITNAAYVTIGQFNEALNSGAFGGNIILSDTRPTGKWSVWFQDLGEADGPFLMPL
jgi:hypothetical protein